MVSTAAPTTPPLTVMCRNLYLGADFLMLFSEVTALPLAKIAANFLCAIQRTDYPERAAMFAGEIMRHQPDVVCLQEVYTYTMRSQEMPLLDFLQILLRQLQTPVMQYEVATVAAATQLNLPCLWNGHMDELQITDSVVMLVRKGVPWRQGGQVVFTSKAELPLPSATHPDRITLTIRRVGCWTDVTCGDTVVRVANTHLESVHKRYTEAQALELIKTLDGWHGPLLIVGDMNAAPTSEAYQAFTRAGYADAFASNGGNTFGSTADLLDCHLDLYTRIDHIFHRGPIHGGRTEVFGITDADRTPHRRLWPSDHAGLLSQYHLPGQAR